MRLRALKTSPAALTAILLTGCTMAPLPNGSYALEPNPAFVTPAAPAPVAPQPTVVGASPLGSEVYTGQFDGGAGTVTIDPIDVHKAEVHLSISSPTGYGDVQGLASRHGNVLVLNRGSSGGSGIADCRITMKQIANTLQVQEINCIAFHGANVDFNGVLMRH
jgi:hypothetical protein